MCPTDLKESDDHEHNDDMGWCCLIIACIKNATVGRTLQSSFLVSACSHNAVIVFFF